LGTGAFMAVGAYTAYNFFVRIEGMPAIAAILLGGVCATAVGILFGIPSLRIKGLYLAVATLAAQFFLDWAFLRVKWFSNYSTSGTVSVADLSMLGVRIDSPVGKYFFCLAFLVVFAVMAKNLVRSHVGRQCMAIRDMDVAAAVIGIRPVYAKLTAFAVSSFIVGVAGGLWGFVHLGSWEPAAFSIDRSFQLLFMIIIGGLGSIMGNFFGAAFIVILPVILNQALPALGSIFGVTIGTALIAHTELMIFGGLGSIMGSFFGAAFIVILPIFLNQVLPWLGRLVGVEIDTALVSHTELMIFGGLIVFFLIVEPHGLARLWSTAKEKLRLWPFPH
jgi:branched-chain amino acid transport system permease protein